MRKATRRELLGVIAGALAATAIPAKAKESWEPADLPTSDFRSMSGFTVSW
jgi:hypothetical protein